MESDKSDSGAEIRDLMAGEVLTVEVVRVKERVVLFCVKLEEEIRYTNMSDRIHSVLLLTSARSFYCLALNG